MKTKGKCDNCHTKKKPGDTWVFYEEDGKLNLENGYEFCSDKCYNELIGLVKAIKDDGFKEAINLR